MAYRQYTQCVDIENFDPATLGNGKYTQAALQGLKITLPAGVFTALLAIAGAASGWCLLLLIEVWAIASVVGFCYWWLYRRLICIPAPPDHPADSAGDHLAIGLLINIEPPGSGDFLANIDNDYSIGILPCPLPPGASRAQVVAGSPYGYLVEEQPVTMDHGLPYAGEQAVCPGSPASERSEVLHCEFEGRGMYDMFLAAQAALFLAVAALFACLMPGLGWIVAVILAILAALGIVAGWAIGQFDQADPNDVNPNIGELHPCADTLLLKGHWVYDSFHTGAYELHPVTFCCITSCPPKDVIMLKDRWEAAINDATSPATLASQQLPQNQWQVHPLIDGCQPTVIV
jgi:hypothetical protein